MLVTHVNVVKCVQMLPNLLCKPPPTQTCACVTDARREERLRLASNGVRVLLGPLYLMAHHTTPQVNCLS